MSLLAAAWMSAIATALLVIGAVVTAFYARNAYREQSLHSQEVGKQTQLLQEQADRDFRQRRRARATQVFTWVEKRAYEDNTEDMRSAACIKNASGQPVYDIELGLGTAPDRRLPVLMPDDAEFSSPGTLRASRQHC